MPESSTDDEHQELQDLEQACRENNATKINKIISQYAATRLRTHETHSSLSLCQECIELIRQVLNSPCLSFSNETTSLLLGHISKFTSAHTSGRLMWRSLSLSYLLPEWIPGREALTHCDFSFNQLHAVAPSVFAALKFLQVLDLSNNLLETLPEDEAFCANSWPFLLHADISHNKLRRIPAYFVQLASIRRLDCSHNLVDALPESSLWSCTGIRSFNASFNKLEHIPAALFGFEQLCEVNVAHNKLSALPTEERWLSPLILLNVSHNQLQHFPLRPDARCVPCLRTLNVAHNNLCLLPESMGDLQALEYLDIRGNPGIIAIPDRLAELAHLASLHVDGGQCPLLPSVVIRALQPSEIRSYLVSCKHGVALWKDFDVMLFGPIGHGKSALRNQLRDQTSDGSIAWSHSAHIRPQDFSLGIAPPTLNFNIWDIESQEEFEVISHCFALSRMLYVLVWSLEETAQQRVNELRAWLLDLHARVPSATVLIVATSSDRFSSAQLPSRTEQVRQDITHYCSPFSSMITGILAVSCKTGSGIDQLRDLLYLQALQAKDVHGSSFALQNYPTEFVTLGKQVLGHLNKLHRTHQAPCLTLTQANEIVRDHRLRHTMPHRDPTSIFEFWSALGMFHVLPPSSILAELEASHDGSLPLSRPLGEPALVSHLWLCRIIIHVISHAQPHSIASSGVITRLEMYMALQEAKCPPWLYAAVITFMIRNELMLPLKGNQFLLVSKVSSMPPTNFPQFYCEPSQKVYRRLYSMPHVPRCFWVRIGFRLLILAHRIIEAVNESGTNVKVPNYLGPLQPSETIDLDRTKEYIRLWKSGFIMGIDTHTGFILQQVSTNDTKSIELSVHISDSEWVAKHVAARTSTNVSTPSDLESELSASLSRSIPIPVLLTPNFGAAGSPAFAQSFQSPALPFGPKRTSSSLQSIRSEGQLASADAMTRVFNRTKSERLDEDDESDLLTEQLATMFDMDDPTLHRLSEIKQSATSRLHPDTPVLSATNEQLTVTHSPGGVGHHTNQARHPNPTRPRTLSVLADPTNALEETNTLFAAKILATIASQIDSVINSVVAEALLRAEAHQLPERNDYVRTEIPCICCESSVKQSVRESLQGHSMIPWSVCLERAQSGDLCVECTHAQDDLAVTTTVNLKQIAPDLILDKFAGYMVAEYLEAAPHRQVSDVQYRVTSKSSTVLCQQYADFYPIARDWSILRPLKHQNIAPLLGISLHRPMRLLMRDSRLGSLTSILAAVQADSLALTWEFVHGAIQQIAQGILYLGSRNLRLRRLSTDFVLVHSLVGGAAMNSISISIFDLEELTTQAVLSQDDLSSEHSMKLSDQDWNFIQLEANIELPSYHKVLSITTSHSERGYVASLGVMFVQVIALSTPQFNPDIANRPRFLRSVDQTGSCSNPVTPIKASRRISVASIDRLLPRLTHREVLFDWIDEDTDQSNFPATPCTEQPHSAFVASDEFSSSNEVFERSARASLDFGVSEHSLAEDELFKSTSTENFEVISHQHVQGRPVCPYLHRPCILQTILPCWDNVHSISQSLSEFLGAWSHPRVLHARSALEIPRLPDIHCATIAQDETPYLWTACGDESSSQLTVFKVGGRLEKSATVKGAWLGTCPVTRMRAICGTIWIGSQQGNIFVYLSTGDYDCVYRAKGNGPVCNILELPDCQVAVVFVTGHVDIYSCKLELLNQDDSTSPPSLSPLPVVACLQQFVLTSSGLADCLAVAGLKIWYISCDMQLCYYSLETQQTRCLGPVCALKDSTEFPIAPSDSIPSPSRFDNKAFIVLSTHLGTLVFCNLARWLAVLDLKTESVLFSARLDQMKLFSENGRVVSILEMREAVVWFCFENGKVAATDLRSLISDASPTLSSVLDLRIQPLAAPFGMVQHVESSIDGDGEVILLLGGREMFLAGLETADSAQFLVWDSLQLSPI